VRAPVPTNCRGTLVFVLAIVSTATASQIIYVDADATGSNDGSSWANAYSYLQDALADANSADKPVEIRVAQGIYKPDKGANQTVGDRDATFQLIDGVILKGGYAGFGESDPNARDIELYQTVLSGDLNGDDTAVSTDDEFWSLWWSRSGGRTENSYHVVTGNGTDPTAVIDGFKISNGSDDRSEPWGREGIVIGYGGGMCNIDGSPTVSNCTFSVNSAGKGGAMYNVYARPRVSNCVFNNNLVGFCAVCGPSYGGAVYNEAGNPIFTHCTFNRNFSHYRGGGMYNDESSSLLNRCVFSRNSGGGMHNSGRSNANVVNCIFAGNIGGGIWNYDSSLELTNCVLIGNIWVGLMCISKDHPSSVQAKNCIFWDNRWDNINNNDPGSTISIFNCDVKGGQAGVNDQFEGVVWDESNINTDPCFADAGHWEDPCDTPYSETDDIWVHGDYHLKSQAGRWDPQTQSWARDETTSPCIDAGDPTRPVGHEPFPNGGIINMGAYGGTTEASKSYFGEPVCETIVAGDLNGDCKVDFEDLAILASRWLTEN
jgi:hypothetical protein